MTTAPSTAVVLLGLPSTAIVDQRLPKTLLADPWRVSAPADARLIEKSVTSARLVGILRPETIRVPAYSDADREVADIAVVEVGVTATSTAGNVSRLAELLHRGMPRLLIVVIHSPRGDEVSLALTHPSKTDPTGQTSVIDAALRVAVVDLADGALTVSRASRTDLWALYRDLARSAASHGHSTPSSLAAEDAVRLRHRLDEAETSLAALLRTARSERGVARRMELNERGRALRALINDVSTALYLSDQTPTHNQSATSKDS